MVYGSNIRLPGEFFNPPSIQIDPETFVTTLQTFMDELKPTESSPPKNQKIFVHKDLKSCTHVFVRVDRVRKALEPPYDGPFPVKERYEKYFILTIKNKPVNISVDRLKPAYLLMTDSIPDKTTVPCRQSDENSAANDTNLLTDVKPTVSRHGRLVKKPEVQTASSIFVFETTFFSPSRSKAKTVHSSALFLVCYVSSLLVHLLSATPLQRQAKSEDVGLPELIYGTEKKRASNPRKNITLTAKEIESSSSSNKISESHTSKLETMNEIKIKQEENLDADEEKLQQPITIIKNDIRSEDLQTFFQKYNLEIPIQTFIRNFENTCDSFNIPEK
ncbi:uncharacterized protein TNCV_762631 [Trichonephila clavipes]|nr:uncharacterized protein TNCV_762631 [Trichonephila clavipes]